MIKPSNSLIESIWICQFIVLIYLNGTPVASSILPINGECPAGSYIKDRDNTTSAVECEACRVGTFSNDSNAIACEPCPLGTANSDTGKQNCSKCEKGSHQNMTQQTTCFLCLPGSYSSEEGAENCKLCEPGQFTGPGVTGQSSCEPCSKGHYSDEEGSETCTKCVAGTYQDQTGSTSCIQCPVGQYTAEEGKAACENCPNGESTNSTGGVKCEKCIAGTFSDDQGLCTDCLPGTYSSIEASTACLECEKGTFSSGYGSTMCTPCRKGTYSDIDGAKECWSCEPGEYSSAERADKCVFCETGKFSKEFDSTECKSCPPGTYSHIEGSISCTVCPLGLYSSKYGEKECKPCDQGKVTNKPTGATDCVLMNCDECNTKTCFAETLLYCKCQDGNNIKVSRDNSVIYDFGQPSFGIAIDTTLSMNTEIDNVRNFTIKVIETELIRNFKSYHLVGFKDKGSPTMEERFYEIDTSDYNRAIRRVNDLETSGGDQVCHESVLGALNILAEKLNKGSIILLFTDAGMDDRHLLHIVKDKLIEKRIRVLFVRTTGIGDCEKFSNQNIQDLVTMVEKAEGCVMKLDDKADVEYVLAYVKRVMPFGPNLIIDMPTNIAELKKMASDDCDCNQPEVKLKSCKKVFSEHVKEKSLEFKNQHEKYVFSNDVKESPFMLRNALDGNLQTSVSSAENDMPNWFIYDLISLYKIFKVTVVMFGNYYATTGNKQTMTVGISNDVSVMGSVYILNKFDICGKKQKLSEKVSVPNAPIPSQTWKLEFPCDAKVPKFSRFITVYTKKDLGINSALIFSELKIQDMSKPTQIKGEYGEISVTNFEVKYESLDKESTKNGMLPIYAVDGKTSTYFTAVMRNKYEANMLLDIKKKYIIFSVSLVRRKDTLNPIVRKMFRNIYIQLSNMDVEEYRKGKLDGDLCNTDSAKNKLVRPLAPYDFTHNFQCNNENAYDKIILTKTGTKGSELQISEIHVRVVDL